MVLSVADEALTAVKVEQSVSKTRRVTLATEMVPSGADEKAIAEQLKELVLRVSGGSCPVVLALPRHQVTCRYIRIPSVSSREVAKMITLQAVQYLPYPAEELITGYERVRCGKDGFEDIHLVILHKVAVERLIRIARLAGLDDLVVAPTLTGLSRLYAFLERKPTGAALLAGVHSRYVELVVVDADKTVFSRSFTLNQEVPGWEQVFDDEVRKTLIAYENETGMSMPRMIVLLGDGESERLILSSLKDKSVLPLEIRPYSPSLLVTDISEDVAGSTAYPGAGWSALVGLGLAEIPDSMNLIPSEMKMKDYQSRLRRNVLQVFVLLLISLAVTGAGIWKALDNKAKYLELLQNELKRTEVDVRPLAYADRKRRIMEARSLQKLSSLAALAEIFRIMPKQVFLTSVRYEDNIQLILKGQSEASEGILTLASALKNSPLFQGLAVNVHYITWHKIGTAEIADFEIVCSVRGVHAKTAQP